ncbi:ABC transporter permease [Sulfurospirillum arsenophilum]|uniref:ABC transporter permease n=1 Tax=Sulfurospirillum arsenophilum TaxID=56698 RepID=UPI000B0F874D|nr:iron ABC transporter permease [Sulfurospirillum arsenophilum]
MQTFKHLLAPLLGLVISLPIFSLVIYFIAQNDFSMTSINPAELLLYTKNTAFVLFGTAFLVLFLGISTAFMSARFEYFGSRFFSLIFVLPLAFPAYILGYSYVGFFEFHGILATLLSQPKIKLDILNIYGVTAILSFAMFPYVFILARVSFASISSTVVELVSLKQLSFCKAFFTVYLPLAYPAIFAGLVLAMMEVLSDYGTVAYFGVDTFSVGIFKSWFGYGNLNEAINLAIIMLFMVFIMMLAESRFRAKFRFISVTHSSKKAPKVKLRGLQNGIAFGLSMLISTFTLFIPTGVLLYWFYLDFNTLDWSSFTYLYRTLSLNVLSSLIIIALAFGMVYASRFYPSKLGVISHKLSILGYSIPGAIIGIGILLFTNFIDQHFGKVILGGSFFALIFAYLSRYFAASIGSVENGFSKIDKSIDDATIVFGTSEWGRIFKVYLPLMRPYLLSGFLILYIDLAKELPATLLLRPFNYDTIAIRIYELASNEILYKSAFPSLLLVVTTAIAVLLLNSKFVRGRR